MWFGWHRRHRDRLAELVVVADALLDPRPRRRLVRPVGLQVPVHPRDLGRRLLSLRRRSADVGAWELVRVRDPVHRAPLLAVRDCDRHAVDVLAPPRRRRAHRRRAAQVVPHEQLRLRADLDLRRRLRPDRVRDEAVELGVLRDDRLLPRDRSTTSWLADAARPRDLRDRTSSARASGRTDRCARPSDRTSAHGRRRSRSAFSASGSCSSGCSASRGSAYTTRRGRRRRPPAPAAE